MRSVAVMAALAIAWPAAAQDTNAWLEAQGLEAVESKSHEGLDVVIARTKGAKDAATGGDRVVVLRAGKPQELSSPLQDAGVLYVSR